MSAAENPFEPIYESVYRELYERIIYLKYEPGHKLIESKLAEEMGISRSPVKLALERLEAAHLVTKDFGKSPCVMPIAYEDCLSLIEIRKGIESIAAFYAAKRITSAELSELKTILMNFRITDTVPTPEFFAKNDAQFHRIIIRASGNPYLMDAYSRIEGNMLRYRLHIMRKLDLRALREYENHIALYTALKDHSPVLAREEMMAAIDNMYEALRNL